MERQFKRKGVIKAFGQWAVTEYGIENLSGPDDYDIPRCVLDRAWWSDHMREKNWVNHADFDRALAFAREHFGIVIDEAACGAGAGGANWRRDIVRRNEG